MKIIKGYHTINISLDLVDFLFHISVEERS